MERQLFFKKPLVTHGLHQNGSPCIPGLSWMREKSWSGIDLSTSEGLGHSSGGMFVLLGRSNVSQMRLWGWKPGQFRKGPDILEHHMLNMSQQPQTILKNVMFQCINRSRSCRTWEATLPLWNMFARPQLEWDVQFLAPYVGSRAGGSWVDRDGAVYSATCEGQRRNSELYRYWGDEGRCKGPFSKTQASVARNNPLTVCVIDGR